ncbi:MAG: C4-dicarboxylate ABC transporter [Pelagibacteraceae bacterium BACL20 MAG-120920-bin64]|jgi:C4-dicarboxylate transporter, DctM subunit|uniref:TRAP transporter large permease n=1 Tax=Candidatus Pelagibacter sp. TaxID=2024849 RepID=UPI00071314AE|nr:MAG: C4-dicarboxylate ABC transporter [Pelagibacteraceae bacterium BACL20 MAG-120920-bin64]NQW07800.1 TRAP transporter large permease subunit [Candidatus Pelagibacter sp.]
METLMLFVMVLSFLFVGAPVGLSLGLSSILYVALFTSESLSSVAISLFGVGTHYTLLAIPFFILASTFMSTGGVAKRLIRFAIASVGHFRGGLAMASVLACMMFAALSGSSPATVVAIGTVAIAGMRQVGYSKEFASGIIANAGTLGILIPPSIVMVVYASSVDVSVGRMFLAGVVPGAVAGLMLMLVIYVVACYKNLPAEKWKGISELIASGKDAFWGLFLIVIIMGGIYGGVFTPTEAAAAAAVYSAFVAIFIYRDMGPFKNEPWIRKTDTRDAIIGFKAIVYGITFLLVCLILSFFALSDLDNVKFTDRFQWSFIFSILLMIAYIYWRYQTIQPFKVLSLIYQGLSIWVRNFVIMFKGLIPALAGKETKQAILDATKTTVMLMFIIANALIFAHVLASERIPQTITEFMLSAGFNWFTFLIAVNILLLVGGQFMEPSGLLLIVAPVVFPIAMELGIDPIHLGIIMVVNMEIGMITPPIGLNLFVTSGITGMSLAQVVKAALPFMAVLFVFLIIVTYVPWLSTWLPTMVMGPEIITK